MKQVCRAWLLVAFLLSQSLWGCGPAKLPEATVTATLNSQEVYRTLQNFYEDPGDCQLPCYWGIVPGETVWQDASKFLTPIAKIDGPRGTPRIPSYGVIFLEWVEKPIGGFWPIFWVEDGVVKAIGTNSGWVSWDFDYSLSGLLHSFGIPEEIWIRPVGDSSDDQPYYYLVLWYPSKGIFVHLLGNAEKQDEHLVVCPQDIFSRSPFAPQLLLWDPEVQVAFEQFGKDLLDDDLGLIRDEYRLLQDVSADELTNEEFYDIYTQPNTKTCMRVIPLR